MINLILDILASAFVGFVLYASLSPDDNILAYAFVFIGFIVTIFAIWL